MPLPPGIGRLESRQGRATALANLLLMSRLSNARSDWNERRALEAVVLRRMTIQESAAELTWLYRNHLPDEEHDREKEAYLTELQARLGRLNRGKSL
jgi:hypothetical protein